MDRPLTSTCIIPLFPTSSGLYLYSWTGVMVAYVCAESVSQSKLVAGASLARLREYLLYYNSLFVQSPCRQKENTWQPR